MVGRYGNMRPAHQELVEILHPWLIAVGGIRGYGYHLMTLAGPLEIRLIEYGVGQYSKKGQNASEICTHFEWAEQAKQCYYDVSSVGKWNHLLTGVPSPEEPAAAFCDRLAESLPFFQHRGETLNWGYRVRDPFLGMTTDVLFAQLRWCRLWEQHEALKSARGRNAIARRLELEQQIDAIKNVLVDWERSRPPNYTGGFAERVRTYDLQFIRYARNLMPKISKEAIDVY